MEIPKLVHWAAGFAVTLTAFFFAKDLIFLGVIGAFISFQIVKDL